MAELKRVGSDSGWDIAAALGIGDPLTYTLTTSQLPAHSNTYAGTYYGTSIGQYVYADEQNQFTAIPVELTPAAHVSGWEGAGPQPDDDQTAQGWGRGAQDLLDTLYKQIHGASVTAAISALHDQRRSDGRPSVFLPEVD
jgi:hypothetical protein